MMFDDRTIENCYLSVVKKGSPSSPRREVPGGLPATYVAASKSETTRVTAGGPGKIWKIERQLVIYNHTILKIER